MQPNHRLVLGTAQLGMSYGIANKSGKPDYPTVLAMVREAWENDIQGFDTAPTYGDSEAVLGQALAELGVSGQARIISKLNPKIDFSDPPAMHQALETSLERLQISSLTGLLIHREEQLDHWDKGLADILNGFIKAGRVRKIGVSVYSPPRALQALQTEGIGIVQVPANILDRRFLQAGVFETATQLNKQIYIRSVFLQGLILLQPEELPGNMAFVSPVLHSLESLSAQFGLTRQEMALIYLRDNYKQAQIIFGAETPAQVRQNLSFWRKETPVGLLAAINEAFPTVAERIVNPTLWPQ